MTAPDIVMTALQAVLLALSLYTLAIGVAGLRRRRPLVPEPPRKRFALVTAAHNEEAVIGPHIESLLQQDYPRDLYDIYIVCDNCTDRTAEIARSYGVHTLERTDPVRRGKGFALEWAFAQVLADPDRYDAVCVFDADNLVAPDFLRVMNTYLLRGARAVQGYLGVKNPWDSWVSACYAVAYWATNRVWQLARHNLGLSAALGGTGMCLDARVLRQLGWGATCLTEDLEYTVKLVLHGLRVEWAHEAHVYDEKPVRFSQTVRQRLRWMQGHWNVACRYTLPLLRRFWQTGDWRSADEALYVLRPFFITLWSLTALVSLVNTWTGGLVYTSPLEHLPGGLWRVLTVLTLLAPIAGLLADRAPARSYLYYLLYLLFGFTWIPIIWVAFFRRHQMAWAHTRHTRALRLSDITRTVQPHPDGRPTVLTGR